MHKVFMVPVALLALAAPLAGQADSSRHWTPADKVLAVAGVTALLVDYSSTVWTQEHGWIERNPVLGQHPSSSYLAAYTAAHLAFYAVTAAKLPTTYRRIFEATFLAIETYAATGNLVAGAHLALP